MANRPVHLKEPVSASQCASVPTWGRSKRWGYGPSGGLGLVVLFLVVLLIMGRL